MTAMTLPNQCCKCRNIQQTNKQTSFLVSRGLSLLKCDFLGQWSYFTGFLGLQVGETLNLLHHSAPCTSHVIQLFPCNHDNWLHYTIHKQRGWLKYTDILTRAQVSICFIYMATKY